MENLWHYLKSHYWSNRVHENYEALERASIAAWHDAVLDGDLMKTVCSPPLCQRNALFLNGIGISVLFFR